MNKQTLWDTITFYFLWVMIVLYFETHKQCHKLELGGMPSYASGDKKHRISIVEIDDKGYWVSELKFVYSYKEAVHTMKNWGNQ